MAAGVAGMREPALLPGNSSRPGISHPVIPDSRNPVIQCSREITKETLELPGASAYR